MTVNEDLVWLQERGYRTERLDEFTALTSDNYEHGLSENKCRELAAQQLEIDKNEY